MTEWGVKLWSTNTDHYLRAAEELYLQKQIDYIELYTVPDSLCHLPTWQQSGVPFVIHCAHSMHRFNLSRPEQYDHNRKLLNEAAAYYRELNAAAIIIHPGVLGSHQETSRQLLSLGAELAIPKHHLLLENKPYITLTDDRTAASSPEEIEDILAATGAGFVLDVTHAIKYAIEPDCRDLIRRYCIFPMRIYKTRMMNICISAAENLTLPGYSPTARQKKYL